MKQFHVPQFIEVEDKIFGPLTLKQFLYVIGGAGSVFVLYALLRSILPFFLLFILIIPVGAFFMALAFYKINGQPFMRVLESALTHYSQARLFIWKKVEQKREITADGNQKIINPNYNPAAKIPGAGIQGSKLKDLAMSLELPSGQENK